jgi:hypothetical protein
MCNFFSNQRWLNGHLGCKSQHVRIFFFWVLNFLSIFLCLDLFFWALIYLPLSFLLGLLTCIINIFCVVIFFWGCFEVLCFFLFFGFSLMLHLPCGWCFVFLVLLFDVFCDQCTSVAWSIVSLKKLGMDGGR